MNTTRPPGPQHAPQLAHGRAAIVRPHRPQEATGVPGVIDDGDIEHPIVRGECDRRRNPDVDQRAGLPPRPFRARAADAASGTMATASPDRPTWLARAPNRPPCAQPTCTKRSPILTPVIPTTSVWGLLRRANGFSTVGSSVAYRDW